MGKLTLEWDARADMLYIRCSDKKWHRTKSLDDWRHLDYAADGTLIGVEVLYPSIGIQTSNLPAEVVQLLREHKLV